MAPFPPPPHLIAHRGGAGLAPENTREAFARAVDLWRADAIELDVRATADGVCVVLHDPDVDRTTDGTGPVASLTLDRLRELDAGYRFTPDDGASFPFRGGGVRVPTIDEVLEAVPDTPLIVEVKAAAAERPLREAIRRHAAEARVVPAGEHPLDRAVFGDYPGTSSASAPELRRFYYLHRLRVGAFARPAFDTCQLPELHQGRRIVTPRLVADLHRHGVTVQVWTVNETADMARLLDWGVDGLLTDRPDRLARLLHDRVGRPLPPGARTDADPD